MNYNTSVYTDTRDFIPSSRHFLSITEKKILSFCGSYSLLFDFDMYAIANTNVDGL